MISIRTDDLRRQTTNGSAIVHGTVYVYVHGEEVMAMAATATVRVTRDVRERAKALAAAYGTSSPELIRRLVEEAEDKLALEQMNADFGRLNADPQQRAGYDQEMDEWDATLLDGLDVAS